MTTTINDLKELVKLRQAITELEQIHLLIEAFAETVFTKTEDPKAASAFFLLEETFNAKLEYITALLPTQT